MLVVIMLIIEKKKFKIASTKLYVPIVTLSTKDNLNLTKQLNAGFTRSVYWHEYSSKIVTKEPDASNRKRFLRDASFQGVNRLFVFAFNDVNNDANRFQRDNHRKYFLPRVNIINYNVLIDGRNFYDQPVSDHSQSLMKLERLQQEKEMIT